MVLLGMVFLGMSAQLSRAALVYGNTAPIESIWTYAQYGSGDVVIKLVNHNSPTCSTGFWLRSTDAGFKTSLAMLLSAYHTGRAVTIQAYDDQLWGGSGGAVCLIYGVYYLP
jgi:hypothetical protein